MPMSPSSIMICAPGFTSRGRSLYVMEQMCSSPRTFSSVVRVNFCPSFSTTFPSLKSRVRISGPFVSRRVAIGRFSSRRSFRILLKRALCSACVPCEKLKRATFMPASMSPRIVFSSSLAGPSVHTIFVLRIDAVSFCFVLLFSDIIYSRLCGSDDKVVDMAGRIAGRQRDQRCIGRKIVLISVR